MFAFLNLRECGKHACVAGMKVQRGEGMDGEEYTRCLLSGKTKNPKSAQFNA